MFQTPSPASGSRSVATTALRSAGLMDRDERMRDASDRPGGRKSTAKSAKIRSQNRSRRQLGFVDSLRESGRNPMAAARIAATADDALAIRGAARPTAAGRVRRNAVSYNTARNLAGSKSSRPALEVWDEFVRKRWSPEQRFLNLERMAEDELLIKHRLPAPGSKGSSLREAAVIFKIASSLQPPIQTISLANNNLSSAQYFSTIAHYLPNIANLSLENNGLRVWKDLDCLSSVTGKKDKLTKLRELILIGNPLRELEYKHSRVDEYKNNVIRRFPSLEMLDKEPVTKISFDAPTSTQTPTPSAEQRQTARTFPAEMGPSFMTGVDKELINNFLSRFLPLFDSQRLSLLDVYHESATFSFQASTSIPARARIQGFQYSKEMPNQRNLVWTGWLEAGSRNLSRVGGQVNKMLNSLHIGREDAIKAMISLPKTQHDITGPSEKFCIDAWPVQQPDRMVLFLSLHGQFTEEPAGGVRSFDRSFILAPAAPESRAKANGWDVEILSDQLVVRAYSSHESWRPGPLLVQALAANSAQSASASVPSRASILAALPPGLNIPEAQLSLVVQLSQQTKLTAMFAIDCLETNGWDMARAMANFEQVKGTLGRDAFL
ncbi:NTF2-like protein [Dentipellis sp. KUC8613]|nr:NTF2-like protein [Dentipellis sp. KUC8613]